MLSEDEPDERRLTTRQRFNLKKTMHPAHKTDESILF